MRGADPNPQCWRARPLLAWRHSQGLRLGGELGKWPARHSARAASWEGERPGRTRRRSGHRASQGRCVGVRAPLCDLGGVISIHSGSGQSPAPVHGKPSGPREEGVQAGREKKGCRLALAESSLRNLKEGASAGPWHVILLHRPCRSSLCGSRDVSRPPPPAPPPLAFALQLLTGLVLETQSKCLDKTTLPGRSWCGHTKRCLQGGWWRQC